MASGRSELERLREEVARVLPEAIEMRRHLHSHPELSGQEFQTRNYICEKLTEWSIPYRLCTRHTGVIADIGQGMPCIALRVDTDALPIAEWTNLPFSSEVPGVMHACGHDVHTAVLLGAANVLKGREETLNGTVRLLFQPAEETTGGAEDMIREGCLENPAVSAVLGFHVDPAKAPGCAAFFRGTMNAAATDFTLTVQGKGCHGAHPEQGVGAIVVAAQLITALQSVVSLSIAPTASGVVTIGTIRALTPEIQEHLKDTVLRIAEGTASAYGAAVELRMDDLCPALINDDALDRKNVRAGPGASGARHGHSDAGAQSGRG